MTGKLAGKIAIVTGAGQGLGEAIAKKYIAEGAKVVCVDVNDAIGQMSVDALPEGSAIYVHGDVTVSSDWEFVLEKGVSEFGHVDIVVNNAGLGHNVQASIELPEPEYDRLMNVNVKQYYISAKVIVPYFRKQGGGVFVNISSVSALRPRPTLVWYAASKAAVSATTKGLAGELAKDQIRANAICPVVAETGLAKMLMPGGVDTPEARAKINAGIPLGRFATPEDVANAASFLGSDESSYITGIDLLVDGGRSLM